MQSSMLVCHGCSKLMDTRSYSAECEDSNFSAICYELICTTVATHQMHMFYPWFTSVEKKPLLAQVHKPMAIWTKIQGMM